jgi:putative peptidoglycan lipid II flippase
VLVLSTVVLANRVAGGAIAFTTAFTVFLLPHAVLAHPVITTLSPRLAAHAHRADGDAFGSDLGAGLRLLLVALLPSAALAAVLARPGLQVIQGVGALDAQGLTLVGTALIGLISALVGYSTFFLLTRAAYAVGDVRGPTLVNLGVTVGAVAAMVIVASLVDGAGLLAGLGVVQGVALTAGAMVLHRRVEHRTRRLVGVVPALARGAVAAVVGGVLAAGVAGVVGWDSRPSALVASGLGAGLGGAAVMVVLRVLGSPELGALRARLPRRRRSGAAPGLR